MSWATIIAGVSRWSAKAAPNARAISVVRVCPARPRTSLASTMPDRSAPPMPEPAAGPGRGCDGRGSVMGAPDDVEVSGGGRRLLRRRARRAGGADRSGRRAGHLLGRRLPGDGVGEGDQVVAGL